MLHTADQNRLLKFIDVQSCVQDSPLAEQVLSGAMVGQVPFLVSGSTGQRVDEGVLAVPAAPSIASLH